MLVVNLKKVKRKTQDNLTSLFMWRWGGGGGGGWGFGVLNKVFYRGAPLQGPTLFPFLYHFTQKRYPFLTYFLLRNDISFTYLLYNLISTLTAVNELVHVNKSENENVFATFSQP